MIFDDDYEHKLCFGLADFLRVRENQSQINGKSFVSENSKSKVERVTEGTRENDLKSSVFQSERTKRITWHVFIGWRKSSVLRQLRTEFNLFA